MSPSERPQDGRLDDPNKRRASALPERSPLKSGAAVKRRADRCLCRSYLPPQTVPATLTTGTPTALPYSVQEPS